MGEFLKDLKSPSWWAGVVVVGIVVHLLSEFLKSRFDVLYSRYSERSRLRNEIRQENRKKKIDYLIAQPQEQVFVAAQEMRNRLQSQHCFLCALSLWVVGLILAPYRTASVYFVFGGLAGVGSVMALIGLSFQADAQKLRALLRDARRAEGVKAKYVEF